jgi:phosphoglycolate phosphatase
MKFEAVLFDLDGTLLDSIEDLTDSMNIVLDGFGFPGHDTAWRRSP